MTLVDVEYIGLNLLLLALFVAGLRPMVHAISLLFEESKVNSMMFLIAYMTALSIIHLVAVINKRYEMNGKAILFLGAASYFFYLAHIWVGWFVATYFRLNDLLFWTLISLVVATFLTHAYNKGIINNTKRI